MRPEDIPRSTGTQWRSLFSIMHVGTLTLTLMVSGSASLKDKRRVVRSLMDRVRREYHVAIAEVDDLDRHQRATLGIACVSNDAGHANAMLDKVLDFIETNGDVSVAAIEMEILHL